MRDLWQERYQWNLSGFIRCLRVGKNIELSSALSMTMSHVPLDGSINQFFTSFKISCELLPSRGIFAAAAISI